MQAVSIGAALPQCWRALPPSSLRVVPQLQYHPSRKLAIDLVLFINGIPVATVELKTDFTQSAEAAMDQYRTDRLPYDPKTKRREPLLTFKRGAVVHFAMSDSEIQMATKLDGENTFFLPFNQGNDGHAGNPAGKDGKEYPVAYFWESVCQGDAWLRIFHSFVYVEKKDVVDLKGNWSKKETLIFPRYHQWDAVNAMIADAKANGPGMQYLCEHSAGSGKTSTISWTAHDLVKLRMTTAMPSSAASSSSPTAMYWTASFRMPSSRSTISLASLPPLTARNPRSRRVSSWPMRCSRERPSSS